jgi:allophanate hydrolase subunit 2
MIEVLQSGLHSTIQDLGRFGYRNLGVPVSGAMDVISANMANFLLDNQLSDAVVEISLMGPKLLFNTNTLIAITGGYRTPRINGKTIYNDRLIIIKKGDVLSFGNLLYGVRSYLAVKGGFQSELKLDSRSQFKNITKNVRLEKGEKLIINEFEINIETSRTFVKNRKQFYDTKVLKVVKGLEYDMFSDEQISFFFNQTFFIQTEKRLVSATNSSKRTGNSWNYKKKMSEYEELKKELENKND